jgi:NAD(P)-dependent dehydrogenase (short-subunit alcohol dehydrogenase family)
VIRRRAPIPISGRVVAITGGARGIGLSIARAAATRGARVVIGDLDGELAVREAAEIGPGAVGLPLDVASTESFAAFLEEAARRAGPLDVLVNNAGVMWVGPHAEEPEDAARRQMEVNFGGVVRGVRLAVPRLRGRPDAQIVTIASAATKFAPAGEATYAATKHAVIGYLTAVRAELRGEGIALSVVNPVVVETELAKGTSTGRSKRLEPADVSAAVLDVMERPRFEVWVPRSVGRLAGLVGALPWRARDVVFRLAIPDQRETDHRVRDAYEQRTVRKPDS